MKILPVKGTRDFYPKDKAFLNWLYQKIKKVSEKYGYQEFDGPELEHLELYLDKTSEEILKEQAFLLKDRDGRDLILRPEITPTFARMVAQQSGQLIKPIKWFSFGRCFRYEQPQKGRAREFFQWEINVLGPETPEADAEIIVVAVEYLRELGLTPEEVVIRVNDRSYFEQTLKVNNIALEKFAPLLRVIDKKEKVTPGEFDKALGDEGLNAQQVLALNNFFADTDFSKSDWLQRVFEILKLYPEVLDYVQYDPVIARGFAYYTRTVFEAWDKTGNLKRALFGGGRFDNLTERLGGERVPGVGMAPGDVPMQALLEALGKMPALKPTAAAVLVTVFSEELAEKSIEVGSKLRSDNINSEIWLDPATQLDRQLKYADTKGIQFVVIIGPEEIAGNFLTLKNLNYGTQEKLSLDELASKLRH